MAWASTALVTPNAITDNQMLEIQTYLAAKYRTAGVQVSGEVDAVLLPASTSLVRLAPPSFLAAYTFHFKQKQRLDEAGKAFRRLADSYVRFGELAKAGVRTLVAERLPSISPLPSGVADVVAS